MNNITSVSYTHLQTSSRERKYYICTTYNTKGRRYCSKAHLIEEEDLMEDVLTYIKLCRNALCEIISTYDLKDFEAEKKTVEEKRQELHRKIGDRKNQLKVLLTQKVKDLAVSNGNEDLISETYDSMQKDLLAQIHGLEMQLKELEMCIRDSYMTCHWQFLTNTWRYQKNGCNQFPDCNHFITFFILR